MNVNLRIVSLLPSATEILVALGLKDQLVGVSHECDFPEFVRELPKLTRAKLNTQTHSRGIQDQVVELVQKGLSLYDLDLPLLAALKPDLIVTQDQCDVCAVSFTSVEAAVQALTLPQTRVLSLNSHSLLSVFQDIQRVGSHTETQDAASRLVTSMRERLGHLQKSVAHFSKPKVLCVEWLEPPMIAGGWIPELATLAGGVPQIVDRPTPFRTVSWEEIAETESERVVIFPCGYPLEKTLGELTHSETAHRFRTLSAVDRGHCFLLDGNAYFNRPGPRLCESAEMLAVAFHGAKGKRLFPQYEQEMILWQ